MAKDLDRCEKCNQIFDQVDNKYRKFGGVAFHTMKNNRTGQEWTVCNECMHCEHCKEKEFEIFTNEDSKIWKSNVWLCKNCVQNATPREEHRKSKGNGNTCKECNICSQAIQSKLSKNKDWEVKRKAFWEKKLQEECKCSSPTRGIFYNTHHFEAPQYEDKFTTSIETCKICEKSLGNTTTNKYGDKSRNEGKVDCSCDNIERERERERDDFGLFQEKQYPIYQTGK